MPSYIVFVNAPKTLEELPSISENYFTTICISKTKYYVWIHIFSELCIWYKTCCVCFAITFNIFGLEFGLITLVKDFYGLSTSGLQGELDLAPYTHPVKWRAIKCKTTCSWLKRISLGFVCVKCQHIFHNNLSPSFTGIEILCGNGDVYRWVVWRHCHAEGEIKFVIIIILVILIATYESCFMTALLMMITDMILITGSTLWLR